MKVILLMLVLLVSCSRGSGVYTGVMTDVGYEGWFFKSCEIVLKTSAESSHQEHISTASQSDCLNFQDNMGKKVKVYWKHQNFNFMIDTSYIIEKFEYLD